MVKGLEKIASSLEKLPPNRQDELLEQWLDELQWELKFQSSEEQISQLVNEALEEYKVVITKDL